MLIGFTLTLLHIKDKNTQLANKTHEMNGLQQVIQEQESKIYDYQNQHDSLDLAIVKYLKAEGKNCVGSPDIEECLNYWTEKLKEIEGPECESFGDGICPRWCAAGADYDCCIEQGGTEWIRGRGCYTINN